MPARNHGHQLRAVVQDGIDQRDLQRLGEEDQSKERVGKGAGGGILLEARVVRDGGAEFDDVPKDGEQEGPHEIADALHLLATEAGEEEGEGKGRVREQEWKRDSPGTDEDKECE